MLSKFVEETRVHGIDSPHWHLSSFSETLSAREDWVAKISRSTPDSCTRSETLSRLTELHLHGDESWRQIYISAVPSTLTFYRNPTREGQLLATRPVRPAAVRPLDRPRDAVLFVVSRRAHWNAHAWLKLQAIQPVELPLLEPIVQPWTIEELKAGSQVVRRKHKHKHT